MEKLVELNSITAGYNRTIVIKDVSLSIYRKDFLGIIGPNGGGKTTLLKVILGLLPPVKGTVKFYGSGSNPEKISIGYLPQFKVIDNQFPIKVIDVVLSGLMSKTGLLRKFSRLDMEKGELILQRFGVSYMKNVPIGELSGGQMQRVFLCRALIASPELLILDEPDTFVDSSFSEDLNDILKELNKDITIVLVSHDIGAVLSEVKNIACINGSLHYHSSDELPHDFIENCQCNFRLVGHGDIPHIVLKKHGE